MQSSAEEVPVVYILNGGCAMSQLLQSLIGAEGWRTQAYTSAESFLGCPKASVPSCLVLDVGLVDTTGHGLQKELAESWPELAVVFVTAFAEVADVVRAMKLGAVDFLTSPLDQTRLLRAIDGAISRSRALLARATELQGLRLNYTSLTSRERQVMVLITCGLLNKQVGGQLGISEITVKAHRGQAMRKMKARTLADLVNKTLKLESDPTSYEDFGRWAADRLTSEVVQPSCA